MPKVNGLSVQIHASRTTRYHVDGEAQANEHPARTIPRYPAHTEMGVNSSSILAVIYTLVNIGRLFCLLSRRPPTARPPFTSRCCRLPHLALLLLVRSRSAAIVVLPRDFAYLRNGVDAVPLETSLYALQSNICCHSVRQTLALGGHLRMENGPCRRIVAWCMLS